MDYNLELTQLYEKFKTKWSDERQQGKLSPDLFMQLSCPLLLHVKNDLWNNSKYRILLVGKETFGNDTLGWDNGPKSNLQSLANFLSIPDSVRTIQGVYEGFDFGAKYTRSPFWQAYRQIKRDAENDQPYSVMWTNLYRCSYNGGSIFKAGIEDQKVLSEISREIFIEELKILQPQAVIFTTGPAYDGMIGQIFPGNIFVDFSPELKNQREIVKIEHADLPHAKSIRTYHPNYLLRSKKWELLSKVVDEIRRND